MAKREWVAVKAVARGWHRGRRYRAGDTFQILKTDAVQSWMDLGEVEPVDHTKTLRQLALERSGGSRKKNKKASKKVAEEISQ